MDAAVEYKTAQTILEEGSRLTIPAPFLMRCFGKKKLSLIIHDPSASVCLRITKLRLLMCISDEEIENFTIESALAFRQKHGETVARIVALAALKSRKKNALLGKWLARQLLNNCAFSTLLEVMHLLSLGGLEDFINTIRLLSTMRLTAPKNLSR